MKKLRQGQTIYTLHLDLCSWVYSVEKCFLYSQKVQLPPRGTIITRFPVDYVNQGRALGIKIYTSRRKAERTCKLKNKLLN